MKTFALCVAALVATVTLTSVAAAGPEAAKQRAAILVERQTVTEDGVRFSVRVPTKAGWAGWERFNSATRGTRVTRAIAPSRSAM